MSIRGRRVLCLLLLGSVAAGCKDLGRCTGETLTASEEEVYLIALRGPIMNEGKGRVLSPAIAPPFASNMFDAAVPLGEAPEAELARIFSSQTQPACLSPLGEAAGVRVTSRSRKGLIELSRIAFVGDWAYFQATIGGRNWFQEIGWIRRDGFLFNRTPTGWKLVSVHRLLMS